MGHAIEANEESLKNAIEGGGLVLVDFWAPWCGPCRVFGPIFEKVAAKHPDATFLKVNTDVEQGIAMGLQIQSIPTLMVFRDGVLLFRDAGALPEPALEDLVTQAEGLDMAEVHRQIAEEEAKAKGN
ncbi:MAG: thioredoxin [Sandaracinus sp.]|nr:thioredoxin [Sandaracinus sp.]MCB9632671.1 thioredoxin [Sandaracinus sp.]